MIIFKIFYPIVLFKGQFKMNRTLKSISRNFILLISVSYFEDRRNSLYVKIETFLQLVIFNLFKFNTPQDILKTFYLIADVRCPMYIDWLTNWLTDFDLFIDLLVTEIKLFWKCSVGQKKKNHPYLFQCKLS